MDVIIDKYKDLDPLSTIIFWGIIIIIVLLIIFVMLLIIKKIKKKQEEIKEEVSSIELPVINNDTLIMKNDDILIQEESSTKFEPFEPKKEETKENKVELEKNFIAEEHVMEYKNELFNIPNMKKNNEIVKEEKKEPFVMPTKPYERNVLREMSLSQTSPIGIVRNNEQKSIGENTRTEQRQVEMSPIKDQIEEYKNELFTIPNIKKNSEIMAEKEIKEEKKVEIPQEEKIKYIEEEQKEIKITEKDLYTKEIIIPEKIIEPEKINEEHQDIITEELVPQIEEITLEKIEEEKLDEIEEIKKEKTENEAFLEEVSKKLAEAEVTDEIDRTDYEIKQEEDAIISYKELMEKKDTIKTIDEEDVVISIEELIKRKQEQEKLYNITENEKNDDFINELKKFRSDL